MKSELKCINELKKLPPNTKVRVYYGSEGRRNPMNNHNKGKMTLAKLAEQMNSRFDRVEMRIDNLEQDVKAINARLDYNNLKKLPTSNK